MKKILILHPYLAPYRIDLYNKLNEDYEILVFLYGSKKEKATLGFNLDVLYKQANFKVVEIDEGLYIGRHLFTGKYLSLLSNFKPDLVISHELGINTLAMIWLRSLFNFKHYITVDDSMQMAKGYNDKRSLLRSYVYHRVDGVCVVNNGVLSYLHSMDCFKNVRLFELPIIQNDSILLDKFKNSYDISVKYTGKYNLADKKIVLFVGRLIPEKRPMILLEEFLEGKFDDSVLVIVGDGIEYQELKRRLDESDADNVIITGALFGGALYAWYNLADVLVLPSAREPFGAVVNEALVAGCRVLVSDAAGSAGLVDTTNGLVFDSSSQEDFANKLRQSIKIIDKSISKKNLMTHPFNEVYYEFKKYLES